MKISSILLGSTAFYLLIAPSKAFAQSGPNEGASQVDSTTEVVVTAERRRSTAQKTPLSIVAIGAAELEKRGITNPQDLAAVVPGLRVANGTINLNLSMRGVGTSNSGPIGLSGIAAYVDGVYINRPIQGGMIFDLNRVEALAGPQGTLYGRGATGGAVNFVHNRPTDWLEAAAKFSFSNYNAARSELMLNVPINSWLSARASYLNQKRDGFFSNGYQDQNEYASNIQLLATPTDKLSVLFSFLEDHSDETGAGQIKYPYSGDPFTKNTSALGRIDQHREHYLLQADYDFDAVTLTYVGALTSAPIRQVNWVNKGSTTSIEVEDHWNQQELRLTSKGDSKLRWTAGLFYLDTDLQYHSKNIVTLGEQFTPVVRTKSIAVYGQATYSVTDTFRTTLGLRYSKDDTKLRGSLFQPPATNVGPFSTSTSSKATNWKLGLEWDLAPQSLIYANVGDGYRPGGLNQTPPPSSYEPETVKHYEFGSKNRYNDGKIQFNMAAFYDDYANYFQGGVSPIPGFPSVRSFQVVNAGAATIKGISFDFGALITPNDKFTASWNLLNTKFDRFTVASVNYAGDPLPYSPKTTLTLGYEHTWHLSDGAQIEARLDNFYSSAYTLEFNHLAGLEQKAFNRTDARLAYRPDNGRWGVSVYAKNLQDERVLNYGSPLGTTVYQSFDAPKTYGISFDVKY
jgi:iron complex outermembrane receptor protein